MSLRRRLFLLLGGLICLLLVGQWLLFRSLTQAVTDDVRTVAFRVGEEILSGFSYRTESRQDSGGQEIEVGAEVGSEVGAELGAGDGALPGEGGAGGAAETHVVVVTTDTEAVEPTPSGGEAPPHVRLRRELHFKSPGPAPAAGVAVVAGTVAAGKSDPAGPQLRKMVLETDAARDVLFVRGPAMQRRIPIPNAAIATTLDRFGSRLLLGNLALLAAGLLGAAVMAHRLTRPLASLTAAAERVGSGELGAAVEAGPAARADEVGRAITAFNRMSARLAELDRENRRLAAAEQLSELGEVARGLAHSLRNPLNALGLAIEQVGAPPEVVESSPRGRSGAWTARCARFSPWPRRARRRPRRSTSRSLHARWRSKRSRTAAAGCGSTSRLVAPVRSASAAVPAELKAVLQALVVNAVEASPAGGRVAIRVERRAAGVCLTIDDEGGGLSGGGPGAPLRTARDHQTARLRNGAFSGASTGERALWWRAAARGAVRSQRWDARHARPSATACSLWRPADERRTPVDRRGRGRSAQAPRRPPRRRGLQRRLMPLRSPRRRASSAARRSTW